MCMTPQTTNMATTFGGAAMGAFGAYGQARDTQAAYRIQAAVNANKADLSDMEARDALRIGQQQDMSLGLKTGQLEGAQRASLAARGIDIGSGSALDTLVGTKLMSRIDQQTIADNANKEALALHGTANIYRSNAGLYADAATHVSPLAAGGTSLLNNAKPLADAWYKWKGSQPKTTEGWAD